MAKPKKTPPVKPSKPTGPMKPLGPLPQNLGKGPPPLSPLANFLYPLFAPVDPGSAAVLYAGSQGGCGLGCVQGSGVGMFAVPNQAMIVSPIFLQSPYGPTSGPPKQ